MSWVSRFLRQARFQRNACSPAFSEAAHGPASGLVDAGLGDALPLVHPDFPIAMCWRPKSACTTVLKWFLFHTGLLDEALAYSGWPHDYREQKLFPSPGYTDLCRRSLFGNDKFVVKVIRDPARRAVSGFLHLIRQTSDRNIAPWPDISSWKQSVGLGDQIGLTFHQFMRYVVDRKQAGRPLDSHLVSQRCPVQDPRVDAFLPIENLTHELQTLERRFDLPPAPLADLSESVHHNLPTAGNRWMREAGHVVVTASMLKSLGTPSPDVFLDEETLRLIAVAYAEDYAAYGMFYESPLWIAGNVETRGERMSMPNVVAEHCRAA